jgi:hypothetical protein
MRKKKEKSKLIEQAERQQRRGERIVFGEPVSDEDVDKEMEPMEGH